MKMLKEFRSWHTHVKTWKIHIQWKYADGYCKTWEKGGFETEDEAIKAGNVKLREIIDYETI